MDEEDDRKPAPEPSLKRARTLTLDQDEDSPLLPPVDPMELAAAKEEEQQAEEAAEPGSPERFAPQRLWVDGQGKPMGYEDPTVQPLVTEHVPGLLRVVSYNLLCSGPRYAKAEYYPHCPPDKLAWPSRSRRLIHELLSYEADVYCLQEVSPTMYDKYLNPLFRSKGYRSEYVDKWMDRWTQGRNDCLGMATFWRTSEFESQYSVAHHLFQKDLEDNPSLLPASLIVEAKEGCNAATTSMLNHFMRRADGVLLVGLKHKTSERGFTIANTHLYWDAETAEGSSIQTLEIFVLSQIVEQFQGDNPRFSNLMMMGDYNSGPGGGAFELLSTGMLTCLQKGHPGYAAPHWKACSQSCPNLVIPDALKGLQTGHSLITGQQAPEWTHHTKPEGRTIDHVWIGPSLKECMRGILKLPYNGKEEALDFPLLPDESWPSDHIAVGVVLDVGQGQAASKL